MRLSDRIAELVEEAYKDVAERVDYEVIMMPTAQGMDALIFAWMPGPVMGTQLGTVAQIQHPQRIDDDQVTNVAGQLLEQLRTQRSQALHPSAESNGQEGGVTGPTPARDRGPGQGVLRHGPMRS